MLPIGLSILTLTLRMFAWRRHIAASALNVTFAKPIARCLSTMSWVVNTCLGIASNIESTSLLCWPSGAGARHRRRMSSQVCSLYRCEYGWSKRVLDIHTIWITYSSYRYGPWRIVINAYFSSDLVQFDWGGTTQNLGRIVPEVGADRPCLGQTWGGSTRGGSNLGRIVCKPPIPISGLPAWDINYCLDPTVCIWALRIIQIKSKLCKHSLYVDKFTDCSITVVSDFSQTPIHNMFPRLKQSFRVYTYSITPM